MHPDPNSPRPANDDDARDPLLAALRQHLGPGYGAPPPPGAWAGIRQRLVPVPPRPWWRRPRRLLPLLALLVGLVAVSTLRPRPDAGRPTGAAHRATPPATQAVTGSQPAATETPPAAGAAQAVESQQAMSATSPSSPNPARQPTTGALAAAVKAGQNSSAYAPPAASDNGLANDTRPPKPQAVPGVLIAGATRHLPATHYTSASNQPQPAEAAGTTLLAASGRRAGLPRGSRLAALGHHSAAAATTRAARHSARAASGHLVAAVAANGRTRGESHAASRPRQQASIGFFKNPPYENQPNKTALATTFPVVATRSAVDSLPSKLAALALVPAAPLPSPLAARPDSAPPRPPVRRWSVLALAGPTLSYRVIGAAGSASATTVANNPSPTLHITTVSSPPDVVPLERPAAGLAAQVQLRRQLSGRWGLAVGMGYQEYATRLALQVRQDTAYLSVHQRDTYRLLTLPVQLSYALAAPRGRLATALLIGTEPGWYQGGRSTEGSDCSCQQQVYTSASRSPYYALSLGLSLGLDLRYRVGSPASRWQWVVQPTGRYVLTPFVRNAAFAARQPFSLGLLTGFSWDL